MFDVFKEKQVQINLIDAGLFCIGILMLIFSDPEPCSNTSGMWPNLTNIPVYIVLGIILALLAVLNHFTHELLGKRIVLYAFNFVGLLILCYTPTNAYSFILYIGFAFISDFIYKKFIDPIQS